MLGRTNSPRRSYCLRTPLGQRGQHSHTRVHSCLWTWTRTRTNETASRYMTRNMEDFLEFVSTLRNHSAVSRECTPSPYPLSQGEHKIEGKNSTILYSRRRFFAILSSMWLFSSGVSQSSFLVVFGLCRYDVV